MSGNVSSPRRDNQKELFESGKIIQIFTQKGGET